MPDSPRRKIPTPSIGAIHEYVDGYAVKYADVDADKHGYVDGFADRNPHFHQHSHQHAG